MTIRKLILTLAFLLTISCFASAQTPGTSQYPTSLDTALTLFETANRANSTLAGAINADSTSLTLADASLFPSSGAITVDSEIIYYTGKSGNQLTGLLRGRDSTVATVHSMGAAVSMRITSQHHQVLSSAIRALQAKLGIGSDTPAAGEFLKGGLGGSSSWATISSSELTDGGNLVTLNSTQTITANKTFSGVTKFGSGTNENEGLWAGFGATGTVMRVADSSSASPSNSETPVISFQTWRGGGSAGNAVIGYPFAFYGSGRHDVYGVYSLVKWNPDMTGFTTGAGLYNIHGARSVAIASPTNIPGGGTIPHVYGHWIQGERQSSGVFAVGAQIDVNNMAGVDADPEGGVANTTTALALNNFSNGKNTQAILVQGGNSNETSFSIGLKVPADAIYRRVLDFKHATFTLEGTVTANGTTTVTGTGTDFDLEVQPGDYLKINGAYYQVNSVIDDDTLVTSAAVPSVSGATVTKIVTPMQLAPYSWISARNLGDTADIKLIGLADSGGTEFVSISPNGTQTKFGGAIDVTSSAIPAVLTRQVTTDISSLGLQAAMRLGLRVSTAGHMNEGEGPSILFDGDDSALNKEIMGRIGAMWDTSTDGAEAGSVVITTRSVGDSVATVPRLVVNSTGITSLYYGTSVASASTITPTGNAFTVSGSATITNISTTGLRAGTIISMIFSGTAQVTDGGNLILAGNFTGGANRTLTLLFDGTNWHEISRSSN